MATTTQLRADIDKLKKAIASKFTPKSAKPKLEAQLKRVEKELADKKSGKATTSTTASTKATFKSLKDLVRRTKELSIYKGSSESNLQNDAERKALPSSSVKGRRVSQGLRSNQYGDKGSNKGHIYYEYRKNRIDVKQPRSKQRYPILEGGGMMAKGGGISDAKKRMLDYIEKEWRETREDNYADIDYVISRVKYQNQFGRGYLDIDSNSRVYNTLNLGKRMGLFYEITDRRLKTKRGYWLNDVTMAKGGLIKLESVGSAIDTKTKIVYPILKSGKVDLNDDGVYLSEVTDEWMESLSKKDKDVVNSMKKHADGGMMAKGGETSRIKKADKMRREGTKVTLSFSGNKSDLYSIKNHVENKWYFDEENFSDYGNEIYFYDVDFRDAENVRDYADKKYPSVKSSISYKGKEYADGGMMAEGGETQGSNVKFLKGYGYWDLSKYPYGSDFKRFKGGEEGVFVKGYRKKGKEIVVKLNDGRNIITEINSIDLPTIEERDNLYEKNKHLFSFGFADGGMMAKGGESMKYGGFVNKDEMSSYDKDKYTKAVSKGVSIDWLDTGISFGVANEYLSQNLAKAFSDIGYDTKVVSGASVYGVWVKKGSYADGGMAERGMEMPNGGGIQSSTHKLHR